jgi:hypothetical protein
LHDPQLHAPQLLRLSEAPNALLVREVAAILLEPLEILE